MANEFSDRQAQRDAKVLGHMDGMHPQLRTFIRAVQERYLTTTTTTTTSSSSSTTSTSTSTTTTAP